MHPSVKLSLQGYAYTNQEESIVEQKSTSSCFLTVNFSMISRCSRKQNFVALSTTEAEYITSSVRSNVASQDSKRFT
jgi:hypothetical protein